MLEKPDLQDEKVIACVQDAYGLRVVQLAFLPLGADLNTAVYRVIADDHTPYFLKLRRGVFDETSVTLPKWLSDQGIAHIIPPLATTTGQLWTNLATFIVMLYPFIDGQDGYAVDLSDRHWQEFGSVLKRIHTADVPPALSKRIQQETYTPQWRASVMSFLARVEVDTFDDPTAAQAAAILQAKRDQIRDLVARTEQLAQALQARPSAWIVCHADLHAGNFLIGTDDILYIVDWDNPILAPKERDLMFVGGGLMGGKHTPQAEENLFYAGYGHTQVDPIALAYYRYERIIQDIAVECEHIFSLQGGNEDREQELDYLTAHFLPNNVLAIACSADQALNDQ